MALLIFSYARTITEDGVRLESNMPRHLAVFGGNFDGGTVINKNLGNDFSAGLDHYVEG